MAIRTRYGSEVKILQVDSGIAQYQMGGPNNVAVVVSGCPLVDLRADGGQEELDAAVREVQGKIVLNRTGEAVTLLRVNLETGEVEVRRGDGGVEMVHRMELSSKSGVGALREAIHSLPWF